MRWKQMYYFLLSSLKMIKYLYWELWLTIFFNNTWGRITYQLLFPNHIGFALLTVIKIAFICNSKMDYVKEKMNSKQNFSSSAYVYRQGQNQRGQCTYTGVTQGLVRLELAPGNQHVEGKSYKLWITKWQHSSDNSREMRKSHIFVCR